MNPILLIAQRELRERIGAKSFRFFTIGLLVLALGIIVAVDKAPEIFGESEVTLGIVGEPPEGFHEALERVADSLDVTIETRAAVDRASAESMLQAGDIDAFLDQSALVYDRNESSTLTSAVNQALYIARLPALIEQAGISPEQAQALLDPQPADVLVLDPADEDEGARQFLGFLAAVTFYVTLAIYGSWILTGVVEEKSSRIVEVLLGLVRPYQILSGKTFGIVLVALLQLGAAICGVVAGLILVGAEDLPDVALDVLLFSVPLYVLGVLQYSLIYAAVGSTVTRQSDAQAAATPIAMLMLVPYMSAAIFVPDNPDGPAAVIMSLVPLTSPFVMPSRVAIGSPSVIELVACYGLIIPGVMLAAWLGGRVYSSSILSGRRMNLAAVLKTALSRRGPEQPSL